MKRILVPTDFSIGSLNVIHGLVSHFDEPVNVILFHAVFLSNSITDLLFMNNRITQSYITKDYADACEILRNKYSSKIKSLKTVFFYGSSSMVFNNFIEGEKADCIVYNEQHRYKETYKLSLDPMPFIRKAKCRVLPLNIEKAPTRKVSEDASLSELLLASY